MASARRAFQADKDRRDAMFAQRTQEIYRRLPRVEEIDRELRYTVGKLMIAAFEEERDPQAMLEKLRDQNLSLQRERAELLVGSGYPYDALDEVVLCKHCGDTGNLSDGSPCRCLMAYYTKEQNRRLSKMLDLGSQSFDTFSLDWYDSERHSEYGISPLKNMEIVLEYCCNYAHTFGARSGNLLFTGAPGLGKTFLSACIAREVSTLGFSVVYDTAAHIFQQFESGKFGRDNPYEEDPDREINRYLNCDLLIMDDLGTEMTTSFVQSAFYRIVNERLINHRKTILSTNLTLNEIGTRYGAAVKSRIEGEYKICRFFGKDIRIQKKKM
ncbi:MAG: ATP-binding protein [Oscillospiraceae bacterium]|nr:ATP-binding protein [Oscillospiraceae bacterium]